MAATPDGKGYWLVAADGGIFTFGDAGFFGSWAADDLPDPVVGIVASPDGEWIHRRHRRRRGAGPRGRPGLRRPHLEPRRHAGVGHHRERRRHRILAPRSRGLDLQLHQRHPPRGSCPIRPPSSPRWRPRSSRIRTPATSATPTVRARSGARSSPPGPGGRPGSPFRPMPSWVHLLWAASHGALLPPTATPDPGDAVLYGTGPQNVYTSVHVGIVTQVWPDGAIDTVDGDSGQGEPAGSR
jgi:hypothetical protein